MKEKIPGHVNRNIFQSMQHVQITCPKVAIFCMIIVITRRLYILILDKKTIIFTYRYRISANVQCCRLSCICMYFVSVKPSRQTTVVHSVSQSDSSANYNYEFHTVTTCMACMKIGQGHDEVESRHGKASESGNSPHALLLSCD
jgi:hypothetical protein